MATLMREWEPGTCIPLSPNQHPVTNNVRGLEQPGTLHQVLESEIRMVPQGCPRTPRAAFDAWCDMRAGPGKLHWVPSAAQHGAAVQHLPRAQEGRGGTPADANTCTAQAFTSTQSRLAWCADGADES